MKKDRTLWCVVSPVFRPAPGGAAMYNDILARALARSGDDVVIYVEKHPRQPSVERLDVGPGVAEVRRVFPHRAGRARRDLLSYTAFMLANATYLRLPRELRDVAGRGYTKVRILMHASLLNYPSLLPLMFRNLRRTGVADTKLLLDVRDFSLPRSRAHLLRAPDRIITSSQKVAQFLRDERGAGEDIVPILMPFERPDVPDRDEVQRVLERHGLVGRRFLFNPNGLILTKQSGVMREAVGLLRRDPRFADVILVTVGRERDRTKADTDAEQRGEAVYLGNIPHREVLSLMKAAMFTVILSDREAISRAALEAMAIGGRVLLPDLPEFTRNCASHVIPIISDEVLVGKIIELFEKPMPDFDFEQHGPESFLPQYQSL